MDIDSFFIQLILILLAARCLGELVSYFRVPAVIGEIFAGILLGPSLLGWIEITPPILLLSQIGIVLLLFEVGLESDVYRLSQSSVKAGVVALMGVLLPFLGGFCVSFYLCDLGSLTSIFLGSALTATSIAVTIRALQDLKKQDSYEAQIILGAAILDDIIGIVVLSILYKFAISQTIHFFGSLKLLFYILLFFVSSLFLAKIMSKIIQKWDEKSTMPGLLPTSVVSLILFFAWLSSLVGAPELLGGFVAGLALSKQFFLPGGRLFQKTPELSEKINHQIKSIVHLFSPIFFVVVGLSLNFQKIEWGSLFIWSLSGSLLVIAVLGKLLSAIFLTKDTFKSKLLIGISMVPRGEVGLIFANVGLTIGILNNELYASLILVIAATTILAPFALNLCRK